ncbi:shikimate kinase [Ketogulonicigenium vulgare]|uniref:shikimate kinase n=1 Tax=Ketogulonicigenium vulgare TaxID=92945 RepID=UPI0002D785A1|nr:shikimate kinase [Ketogulonicigenium vulgare]ALJ80618.1 shikimate kinase [Ketogulonicigenium vulgare]ANW33435.1 shikimate kinase [Ketogulonicigenium vulgare]AOZ54145.1 shikimate kinase [Ketogulonicigenium vulgare]
MRRQSAVKKRYHLHKAVALVGMMGSGKTAVGRAIAQRLSVPFRDSDQAIEAAAQSTIAEIFARDGEPFFRDREAEVIARLLTDEPAIISTGGGAFLAARNREKIEGAGVALWLDASVGILWERVRHRDTRPLLRTENPRKTLEELHKVRAPIYQLAGLRLQAIGGQSVEETASRAVALLLTRPDVLEEI